MTNQQSTDPADSALWSAGDADASLGGTEFADDADVEVEVIAAEIDETRMDLGETIDEIGRRLKPANVAREAGQTVRDATTRKVDNMTTGIQETFGDVRRGDASGIVDTITKNPIPAAMVAVGLGMLFMNRGAQASQHRSPWEQGGYGDGGWQRWSGQQQSYGQQSYGGQQSTMDRAGSRVSSVAEDAGQTVQQFADQAGQRVA